MHDTICTYKQLSTRIIVTYKRRTLKEGRKSTVESTLNKAVSLYSEYYIEDRIKSTKFLLYGNVKRRIVFCYTQ